MAAAYYYVTTMDQKYWILQDLNVKVNWLINSIIPQKCKYFGHITCRGDLERTVMGCGALGRGIMVNQHGGHDRHIGYEVHEAGNLPRSWEWSSSMEVDTGHDRHIGHEVHEAVENSLGQGWGTFLLSKCILIFIILFVGHTKKA